jgi:two-component system phosphate regulon sensor histidine kinase PhoR
MPDPHIFLYAAVVIAVCFGIFIFRRLYQQTRFKDRDIRDLHDQINQLIKQSSAERSELNVILSSMVEGVLVIGKDDKIQYISPNVLDMFDFRSKELTAKPYWEVIPHGQIVQAIKETLNFNVAVSREITILQQQDIYFNLQISPVLNDKKLMGAVAVFHDITELKKLLRMRSEFVANVSHELKTPLTSIKGYVETLTEEGGLKDVAMTHKFLNIIHKQTMRLESLVKDLLTISAIESKEVAMDFHMGDLSMLMQSVMHVMKASLEKSNHKIIVNVPNDLPKVFVDRNRMEQVLINLIDNAIKFTPAGKNIEVQAAVQGIYIKLDVKDAGMGIPPEHLSRLFERFYRVDKSRSIELGGTGLGLAIVKHIVLAHHGRIDVTSKLGEGSTFTVFLPIHKA